MYTNAPHALLAVAIACALFSAAHAASAPTRGAADTPLTPRHAPLSVAFVVSSGAQIIDLTGPWEVFQDTVVGDNPAFQLYTVSDTRAPVTLSGGLSITPDYTFDDAPQPDIVVVGAQGKFAGADGALKERTWLRAMHQKAQLELSVCIGAVQLAEAGLLAGKRATTHHDAFGAFHKRFPDVQLVAYQRYVRSDPVIFTSGGLTAGIDLALHVVDIYFGGQTARQTATYMEYEGHGWR